MQEAKRERRSLRENLKAIGVRVRTIRLASGLNQTEFARTFNVTQVAVSNWERGHDLPKPKVLAELAQMTADPALRAELLVLSGLGFFVTRQPPLMLPSQMEQLFPLSEESRPLDGSFTERLFLSLPNILFPGRQDIVAARAAGNSMSPIVNDGDIVVLDLADRNTRKLLGQMVAEREGISVVVKWLRNEGGNQVLVPNVSGTHDVQAVPLSGESPIIGAVIGWIRQTP